MGVFHCNAETQVFPSTVGTQSESHLWYNFIVSKIILILVYPNRTDAQNFMNTFNFFSIYCCQYPLFINIMNCGN